MTFTAVVGHRSGRGRVGVANCFTTPLTEPDVRSRIRLFGSVSKCQHQLVGDPWGVEFLPACLE